MYQVQYKMYQVPLTWTTENEDGTMDQVSFHQVSGGLFNVPGPFVTGECDTFWLQFNMLLDPFFEEILNL